MARSTRLTEWVGAAALLCPYVRDQVKDAVRMAEYMARQNAKGAPAC